MILRLPSPFESAAARQGERELRTPAQQLRRLDDLLGKGVGAEKERSRLLEKKS